jgi:hypothetical protein
MARQGRLRWRVAGVGRVQESKAISLCRRRSDNGYGCMRRLGLFLPPYRH